MKSIGTSLLTGLSKSILSILALTLLLMVSVTQAQIAPPRQAAVVAGKLDPINDARLYLAKAYVYDFVQPSHLTIAVSMESCPDPLIHFSSAVAPTADGKFDIYVAAILGESKVKAACKVGYHLQQIEVVAPLTATKADFKIHTLTHNKNQDGLILKALDNVLVAIPSRTETVSMKTCAPNDMTGCLSGPQLELSYGMSNCGSRLGTVAYTANPAADGTLDVYVTILRIDKDMTGRLRCSSYRVANTTLPLGAVNVPADHIKVHYLK